MPAAGADFFGNIPFYFGIDSLHRQYGMLHHIGIFPLDSDPTVKTVARKGHASMKFQIICLPSMHRKDNDSDLKLTADVTISLYILFRFIQRFQISHSRSLSPFPVS